MKSYFKALIIFLIMILLPAVASAYTITATAHPGGTIEPQGEVFVQAGASQTFDISPYPASLILDVQVDGVSQGPITTYTFDNVTANHTIQALFMMMPMEGMIGASAGPGGFIEPSGLVYVPIGFDQTFFITPDFGYRVSDVIVDGVSQGAITTYTFQWVFGFHTIAAAFTPQPYTITATAGDGGFIDPSGPVQVNYGASQKFTITPTAGYMVTDVKVDGVSVGKVTTYTFPNVTANHTIAATFEPWTYTITATAGTGGAISPSGAVKVYPYTNQTFTITTKSGYKIADVKVDGVSQGSVTTYTFNDVMEDHTIQASFTLSSPSAGKLIGVNIDGLVVSIYQATGIGTTIGNCGFVVNSLAKDNSGTLFSASGTKLITINPTTGAGIQVATLNFGADPPDVRGLAFSPDNVLYAVVNGYPQTVPGIGPDHLYTVNVSTGVGTLVGDTGMMSVQSIDFSPAGVLYGWDVGKGLITINTTTGVATDVNPSVGAAADIQGIVFGPDGTLYGACNALYKIDVATGDTTLVGAGGYTDIRGLEFGPKKVCIAPVWLLLLN
jgi:hypothetical protein